MLSQRTIEVSVGLFLLSSMLCLILLAFKISGLTSFFREQGYNVTAEFEDIGQLRERASVKIGGVIVGQVSKINLDRDSFKAIVTLHINSRFNDIPEDSSASILTAGLLGDNYVSLTPMYSNTFLHQGSEIRDTHSAMILERLIGQLMFKLTNSNSNSSEPSHANKGATS